MKDIKDIIVPLLRQYNVNKAALFGSYAKGMQESTSDIDILIDPPEDMGMSFITLKHDLEDALQKKIDLVSYNGLSPYLKDAILRTQVPLL